MFEKLFGRKKDVSQLTYDELMQERVKLELEERKTLKELEKLEKQKGQLFEEAKAANSVAVRQVHARQIRDLTHRIDSMQGNVRRLGKLLQVVNLSMLQMEKGQLLGSNSPFARLIYETDSQQLGAWLDGKYTEGSMVETKVDEILDTFRTAEGLREGASTGDPEIDAIMAEIERSAAIEAMAGEMAEPDVAGAGQKDRTA